MVPGCREGRSLVGRMVLRVCVRADVLVWVLRKVLCYALYMRRVWSCRSCASSEENTVKLPRP